jgi:hypothetical protein
MQHTPLFDSVSCVCVACGRGEGGMMSIIPQHLYTSLPEIIREEIKKQTFQNSRVF